MHFMMSLFLRTRSEISPKILTVPRNVKARRKKEKNWREESVGLEGCNSVKGCPLDFLFALISFPWK